MEEEQDNLETKRQKVDDNMVTPLDGSGEEKQFGFQPRENRPKRRERTHGQKILEFQGIFKNFQEFSGMFKILQECKGIFKNVKELSGIVKNVQEFKGNLNEFSGILKKIQEFS